MTDHSVNINDNIKFHVVKFCGIYFYNRLKINNGTIESVSMRDPKIYPNVRITEHWVKYRQDLYLILKIPQMP